MPRSSNDFKRFDDLTRRLLVVSREIVQKRMAQHREQSAQNPRKRGPKPKGSK